MGSDAKDDLPVETATPFAKWLIMYFERLNASTPKNTWELGAQTAREWVRLIEGAPSAEEISSLMGIVQLNRRRSTAWDQMAWGVYDWAERKGYAVPSFDTFYRSPLVAPLAPPPRRLWLTKVAAALKTRLRKGLTWIWPAA